jgi:hypothetical protein
VTIKELYAPLISHLKKEVLTQCGTYVLAMEDWSHVDYKKYISKKELKSENRKDTCMKIGYDHQGAIAVSDRTGEAIGILDHNLKTADYCYSTYDENIDMNLTHLQELRIRAKHMSDILT